jgi:hypothetical protein
MDRQGKKGGGQTSTRWKTIAVIQLNMIYRL